MRTIQNEIALYKYNELSEDAKERALQDFIEGDPVPFLEEEMEEYLHELLKKNKIKYDPEDVSVQYSLGNAQGDGANFVGTVYWKSYKVKITPKGGYCNQHNKSLEITSVKTGYEAGPEKYEYFDFDVYMPICEELERYGYEVINNEHSEENFRYICEANDWEFLEDGTLYD
jgi:hypothetical protein